MELDSSIDYVTALTDIPLILRETILSMPNETPVADVMLAALARLTDTSQPMGAEADVLRGRLLQSVVYAVANHVPLATSDESPDFQRSTVAVANRALFRADRSVLTAQASHADVRGLDCALAFFGTPAVAGEKVTQDIWRNRWAEYAQITETGEGAGFFTWNQFLLKMVSRPHIVGATWCPQHTTSHNHYMHVTPDLAHHLGFHVSRSGHLDPRALIATPSASFRPNQESLELAWLVDRWASMKPKSGVATVESAAWATFHLIRSFGIWGGCCFLSIPVPLGGKEKEAVCILSLCTTQPLQESQMLQWRLIAREIFQPIIVRETEAIVRREAESQVYVQSVDSVGHTLKNRASSFETALKTRLAAPDDVVRKLGMAMGDVGSLLNFQAHLCKPGSAGITTVDAGLVSEESISIGGLLDDILPIYATQPSRLGAVLSFGSSSEALLRSFWVKPFVFHKSRKANVRPLDVFYRELIYEILTNAANRGILERTDGSEHPSVEVSWHDEPATLVFSNDVMLELVRDSERLRDIPEGVWTSALECRGGGLYFNAVALKMAQAGTIEVKWVSLSAESATFQVRLGLKGLNRGSK